MTIPLNKPYKPRNQMSRKERFETMRSEVEYALNLVVNRFNFLSEKVNGNAVGMDRQKVYVVLTTPEAERKVFAHHAAKRLPDLRVVAGRSSAYDNSDESLKRVVVISSAYGRWAEHKLELEDLLESFTVIIDIHSQINTARYQHAQYCRWTRPKESDVSLVVKTITQRYGGES